MPVRLVLIAIMLVMQYAVLFTDHHVGVTELKNALTVSAIVLRVRADTRVLKYERNEYRLSDIASDIGKKVPEVNC